jgi:hypothetical protein
MIRAGRSAAPPPASRRTRPWILAGLGGMLLVLILLALFAGLRGGRQWAGQWLQRDTAAPPVVREVIRVTLAGTTRPLPAATLPVIRGLALDWLSRHRDRLREDLLAALDRRLDAAFAGALARVPEYAAWYFSLSGEYARLFQAATGRLPEFLAARLEALVFGPGGTAAALAELLPALDAQLRGQLQGAAGGLVRELARLLREQPPPRGDWRVTGVWQPEADLAARLAAVSVDDLARQGLAAGAGAAAAALAVKQLGSAGVAKLGGSLAARQSAGMLAALATKLGLKTALKGGAALTAAGGAASVCIASGVGAALTPACALAGGALAGLTGWVLVDKAALEADALLHRDQLERELRAALIEQREALRAQLHDRYRAALEQGVGRLALGLGPAGHQPRQPGPETGAGG